MAWKRIAIWGLLLLALAASPQIANAGGLRIGVGIGLPIYYRPWGPYYPYYAYPPVYYAPAPVYVSPAPVYVQPPNVPQPAYQVPLSPPPAQIPYQSATPQAGIVPTSAAAGADVDHHLQMLSDPDEKVRAASAIQLGRMKADRAVDSLAATLAGDRSPNVREAAARGLGIIGSRRALPALTRAAQFDNDRDVRYSAQFAIDVVQAGR